MSLQTFPQAFPTILITPIFAEVHHRSKPGEESRKEKRGGVLPTSV